MPISIPAEVVIAALLVATLIVTIALIEVAIALRALRRTHIPGAGLLLIAGGLVVGLAQSAFEWAHAYLGGMQPFIYLAILVILATLILSAAVWQRSVSGWLPVALLGAGILYQFAWAGGRVILPGAPLVGPFLAEVRCQRDPYCTPAGLLTTADVELRMQSERGEAIAHGRLECGVDPRPWASSLLRLNGPLEVEGGGTLEMEVGIARAEDPAIMFTVYADFYGQLGTLPIEFAHLNRPTRTDAAVGTAEAARTSAIEFDGLLVEGRNGGERPWPGRVSWSCPTNGT